MRYLLLLLIAAAGLTARAGGGQSPTHVFEDVERPQWLNGPDGTTWLCTATVESDREQAENFPEGYTRLVGYRFTYTVYDSEFKLVGTVSGELGLADGEVGFRDIFLSPVVTQRFFNGDDKYELVVATVAYDAENEFLPDVANAPTYDKYRSTVYSIGGAKGEGAYDDPVGTYTGYLASRITNATGDADYLGFLSEEYSEDSEDSEDSENLEDSATTVTPQLCEVVRYYRRAEDGGAATLYDCLAVAYDCLPGEYHLKPAHFITEYDHDGAPGIAVSCYSKPYREYVNGESTVTPGNNFVIRLYEPGSDGFELRQRTEIPMTYDGGEGSDTYYCIGDLFDGLSVNYGSIDPAEPDRAAFVVLLTTYDINRTPLYSVQQYDGDGRLLRTLCEKAAEYKELSDLPGYEPQVMVIYNDEGRYDMLDLYSGRVVASVPVELEGYRLSTTVDRAVVGEGYEWFFAPEALRYEDSESLHAYADVVRVDTGGKVAAVDALDLGNDVASAQLWVNSSYLRPYLFNSAAEYGYMVKVRRYLDDLRYETRTELLVESSGEGTLFKAEQEVYGDILMETGVTAMGGGDYLSLIWYKAETKEFVLEMYALPLEAYDGVGNVAVDGGIVFDGAAVGASGAIEVYTPSGVCVARGAGRVDLSALPRGVYVVRSAGAAAKLRL